MFEKRVVVGKQYCVITPGPVVISANINNVDTKLINATESGKYFFIAPTTKIYSSIDTKCIFELDNTLNYNISNSPCWLYSLKVALQILLDKTTVKVNLLQNKLVVHTDRADDTQLEAVDALLTRVLPKNIEIVKYNHDISIPWRELPDGYIVVDYLSKDANQYFKFTEGLGTTEDDTEIDFARYTTEGGRYPSILSLAFVCPDSFKSALIGYNVNNGDSDVITLFQTTYYAADGSYTYPSKNGTCGYFRLNDERVTARFSERVCYFNGERKGVIDTEYFLPVCPIGTISIFPGKHIARIYGLKHRSNETGAQLLDLIPCVDDTGAPCLFDRVSRVSFYNAGSGDFSYPGKETEASTYSLRRPVMYGQLTGHGVRRLYHVPRGYNGTREEYAAEFGFKPIVETDMPEDGYWEPKWTETDEEIILEWVETDPPAEESIS